MRTDPHRLFRDADRVPAPDLWSEIERRRPHTPRTPRPGAKILTIAVAFAVAAAGVGFAVAALGRSPHPSPVPAASPEPRAVHPNVTTVGSVGAVPEAMAAADGTIWVSGGQGLAKIDVSSNQVQVVSPRGPVDLAYAAGSVWADGRLDPSVSATVVQRLDPRSGQVLRTTPLDMSATLLAGDDQAVWVAGSSGDQSTPPQLERIDPATGRVVATVALDGLDPSPPNVPFNWLVAGLKAGQGAVWCAVWEIGNEHEYGGFLVRVDEATNTVSDVLPLGASGSLAVGDGAVWTNDYRSSPPPVRIDATTLQERSFDAPNFEPFAVGEGGVWFLQRQNDEELVSRLDPSTLTVDATIPLPFDPKVGSVQAYALDVSSDTVWLAFESGEVTRIDLYPAWPNRGRR